MNKLCSVILACFGIAFTTSSEFTASISSRMNMAMGHSSQVKDYYTQPKGTVVRSHGIVGDVSMKVKVESQLKRSCIGGEVVLNANVSATSSGSSAGAKRAYIYYKHDSLGRLEIGNTYSAGGWIETMGKNYLTGAGGITGSGMYWISEKTYVAGKASLSSSLKYLRRPHLFSYYFPLGYSYATKINYLIEAQQGSSIVRAGISYIPDFDGLGSRSNLPYKDGSAKDKDREKYPPTFKNILSGGVAIESKFNDILLAGHLAGETGKAKKIEGIDLARDLLAYDAGLKITWKDNLTLAATVGSWTKSGTFKQAVRNKKQGSLYWTLGASYHPITKLGISLSYLNSKKAGGVEVPAWYTQFKDTTALGGLAGANGGKALGSFSDASYNKFFNIALSAQYNVTNNYSLYVDVLKFKMKSKNLGGKTPNEGEVLLLGAKFRF